MVSCKAFVLPTALVLLNVRILCSATAKENIQRNEGNVPSIPRPEGLRYTTILSVDGGGLRLLYTTQLLKEIEAAIKLHYLSRRELIPQGLSIESEEDFVVFLADYFNCISGVSAGSWVALYLASKGGGGTARSFLETPQIVEKYGTIECGTAAGLDVFFFEYGGSIYPGGTREFVRRVSFRPTLDVTSMFSVPGLNAPLHAVTGLAEALDRFLGDTKFSELHTSCLVNAFDLRSNGPLLFVADHFGNQAHVSVTFARSRNDPRRHLRTERRTRFIGQESPFGDIGVGDLIMRSYVEFRAKDAALGSSALPIFHPAHATKPINGSDDEFVFIDGALVESNPTLYSLNFVTSRRREIPIKDIAIISLGTGGVAGDYIHNANRGAVGWGISGDMFNIITSGSSEAKEAQVDYLLYRSFEMKPGQYLRINYFAEDPDSEEGEAFSTFNSADHLSTYADIGALTAHRHSAVIQSFVKSYTFKKRN